MKIGQIYNTAATAAVANNDRKAVDTNKKGATQASASSSESSTQVELSATASALSDQGGDPAFDSAKVERIAQAIRDGKFTVNHQAIADKLISNAQELLGRERVALNPPDVTTHAPGLHRPAPNTTELESALGVVEQHLAALGEALAQQDAAAAEGSAGELRASLRSAMEHFAQVARRGHVPPEIRRRLAMASGQIAAQREALFRATTALDQALDILLPRPDNGGVYSTHGASGRSSGRVIAAS